MTQLRDQEIPNKWKSHLASSGVPLEFEAAKILAKKGFAVSADYTYARDDAGVVKDFSVDIEATGFTPFRNTNHLTSSVSLLVECKYRVPSTKWFFLPDPNTAEFYMGVSGDTLHAVDEFSPFKLDVGSTASFGADMVLCYKGVEINERGDVFEREIKHGLSQLQYALPRLFTQKVMFSGGAGEDSFPFFYCPILLTNADLIVAKEELTLRDIEKADSVTDLGERVPFFVIQQDFGPDFERHCLKECAPLGKLEELDHFRVLSGLRADSERGTVNDRWLEICKGLVNNEKYYINRFFTQFVVCNFNAFARLITHVKRTAMEAISTRKRLS